MNMMLLACAHPTVPVPFVNLVGDFHCTGSGIMLENK